MKYMRLLMICTLVLAGIGFSSYPVLSDEPNRLLINIYTLQTGQKHLTPDHDAVTVVPDILVSLLSKQLLAAGFEVIISDSITGLNTKSTEEYEQAYRGNLTALRKIGTAKKAGFILDGAIRTIIMKNDVLGMEMIKAVTNLSFKLIETKTGQLLAADNKMSIGASGSPSGAVYVAADKMSERLMGILTDRMISQPAPLKQNRLEQNTLIKKGYPQIVIIRPYLTRNLNFVEKEHKIITLEGRVIDASGIERLRINKDLINADENGFFACEIELHSGENNIEIVAINKMGNRTTERVRIIYQIDKTPPQITLILPKGTRGYAAVDDNQPRSAKIEGLVKDESGILFLRINDRNIPVSDNGYFQFHVPIEKGVNKILIEAADRLGNVSRKELKVENITGGYVQASASQDKKHYGLNRPKPVFWGLGIGVSRYNSPLMNLQYTDDDVLALEKFFKSQEGKIFSEIHFKTLINEDVSRESVIKSISEHLGQAAPEDVAFIFLAGHGIKHHQSGSYYFLPYDVDEHNILSRGIRVSDFEEAVKILSKNVSKVILAMDTCHSGALNVGIRSAHNGEDLVSALRESSGIYVISAAKSGEDSFENERFKIEPDDNGHGVFTYALLKAMSGEANYDKDGYITLHEIFQYVSKQVPRLTSGHQHPYYRAKGTDMPLISIRK